jgi:hypothetical protein
MGFSGHLEWAPCRICDGTGTLTQIELISAQRYEWRSVAEACRLSGRTDVAISIDLEIQFYDDHDLVTIPHDPADAAVVRGYLATGRMPIAAD